jgi:hypothetical protein
MLIYNKLFIIFCLYIDNYDEAAKKEREIFLSASESEHINYKISNSKSCSSRKLFDTIDNSGKNLYLFNYLLTNLVNILFIRFNYLKKI